MGARLLEALRRLVHTSGRVGVAWAQQAGSLGLLGAAALLATLRGQVAWRHFVQQAFATGVELCLEAEGQYAIARDSTAQLRGSFLLGEMRVEVLPGRAAERLKEDQVIYGQAGEAVLSGVGAVAEDARGALQRIAALLFATTPAKAAAAACTAVRAFTATPIKP